MREITDNAFWASWDELHGAFRECALVYSALGLLKYTSSLGSRRAEGYVEAIMHAIKSLDYDTVLSSILRYHAAERYGEDNPVVSDEMYDSWYAQERHEMNAKYPPPALAPIPVPLLQFPLRQNMTTQCVVDGELRYLYAIEYMFCGVPEVAYLWARCSEEARHKVIALRGDHCAIHMVKHLVVDQLNPCLTT